MFEETGNREMFFPMSLISHFSNGGPFQLGLIIITHYAITVMHYFSASFLKFFQLQKEMKYCLL